MIDMKKSMVQRASLLGILGLLPRNVWAIGVATLLMNSSTIIIFTLSPLYLTTILRVDHLSLGIIEGVVECVALVTRVFAGVISDYIHKRKPLLIASYFLAVCSRLIFPFMPAATWIVSARLLDRVSNGLQATPREALIADIAPPALKGTCYGLRQTLGMIGSFLGAFSLIYIFQRTSINYQIAFTMAVAPSILAFMCMVIFVRDSKPVKLPQAKAAKPFMIEHVFCLSSRYWLVILVSGIYMLANYSGAFMILRVQQAGLPDNVLPLVMVAQNLMAFLAAFPVGWLSDRFGRRTFLFVGFTTVLLANYFLVSSSIWQVFIGVGLWGVQLGINPSLLAATIADISPNEVRGTAFGIYYLVLGIGFLSGNILSGWLSKNIDPLYVFYMSSLVIIAAIGSLVLLPKRALKEY